MRNVLTVHPRLPASRQALTLGDAKYSLRLTWRERTAAWYADLWTAAGVPVWLGQRVTPGWALGLGLVPDNAPDGILLVRGPSSYERLDLGGAVELVFYATADLPVATTEDDGLTITLGAP